MNFISWNCRDTGTKCFISLIKDMKWEYDSSLMFQRPSWWYLTIWCLWDASTWKVDIIESSDEFVYSRVTWKESNKWLITAMYASPNYDRHNQLWMISPEFQGRLMSLNWCWGISTLSMQTMKEKGVLLTFLIEAL